MKSNWRISKKKRYKKKPLANGESKQRGMCNGNNRENRKISK